MQSVGKCIKYWREKKGLTQKKLADKTGLHVTTIGKIEVDMRKAPNIFTLQSIAKALGISLDKLLNPPTEGR